MRTRAAVTGAAVAVALAGVVAARRLAGPLRARVVAQASRPEGRAAGLVAAGMNRGNAAGHRAALAAVHLRPGERLLDVGFGGGGLITAALDADPTVQVAGVDPAPGMVARLGERRAHDVATGRLVIHTAGVEALPFPDGSFDAVTSCFTLYFWPDRARGVAEIARVLAPGGRVALIVAETREQRAIGFDRHGFPLVERSEVEGLLRGAGLRGIGVRPGPRGSLLYVARRPAEG